MRWLWASLSISMLCAGPLDDQLLEELSAGSAPSFSEIEMAIIASGAEDVAQLADYVAQYRALVDRLKLPEDMSQRPARKKIKELKTRLWGFLKTPDKSNYSLIDLLDHGTYSPLTATYLLTDLLAFTDLNPEECREADGRYEDYFLQSREPSKREMVAALFLQRALFFGKNRVDFSAQSLRISRLLSPSSRFGVNHHDLLLYNHAYELYQASDFVKAAKLASAAAACFPSRAEFHALCVNLGAQLCDRVSTIADYPMALQLATALVPHTGQHRATLTARIQHLRYDYARALFEAGDLDEAMRQCDLIDQPHDAAAVQALCADILEQKITSLIERDQISEAEPYFAKLENIDLDRASQLRVRWQVRELQEIYASGTMEQAIAEARASLSTPAEQDHYLNLVSFYVKTRWDEGQYQKAMDVLDAVPVALQDDPLVRSLKKDSYVNWLQNLGEDDLSSRKNALQRALADDSVDFDAATVASLRAEYGNILHEEIKLLIWEDRFVEADQRSNQALSRVPGHPQLVEQRQLLDTILERIENE